MKKKILLMTAIAILGHATLTMAQNVPDYVPKNGLLGWWPFNGSAMDETNNGYNGTVYGATLTTDRFGMQNSAYNFDGKSNYIKTSLNSISQDKISISVWFTCTTPVSNTSDHPTMVMSRKAFNQETGLGFNQSTVFFDLLNNNSVVFRNGVNRNIPTDGNWYNIIGTYNGNVSNLYLNGVLVNSVTLSTNSATIQANFLFGLDEILNNGNRYWKGKLDDIGIWNRALDAIEVSNLYYGNACYQSITVTDTLIIHTNIMGFNPITYQNTIKIWPNPTNDHITIDNGNFSTFSDYQIKINNALGQQVFQSIINQKQLYVDMSTWGGNGIYFVHIMDKQGNTLDIRKIVLTK